MSSERKLLIATANSGKVIEFKEMTSDLQLEIVALDQFPTIAQVAETGSTFAENARLKAAGYAQQTGLPALADDSGLEVAALGGRPGVHSARYGGDVPFSEKIRMLLAELDQVSPEDRAARFVCSIVLATPDGAICAETEGICTGKLAQYPIGNCGFGYDPVFIPEGHDQTFGQLGSAVKARISHRSSAFSHILPVLARFFGVLT